MLGDRLKRALRRATSSLAAASLIFGTLDCQSAS
jgi:hypothetical protein